MSLRFQNTVLHTLVLLLLLGLFFVLSEYHAGNLARIMVFAVYAMGYNLLFGYTGLLSLGHAVFFSAGMYGLGLSMHILGLPAPLALLIALITSIAMATIIGLFALRTTGVAFMIVTLMFAQAGYLSILLAGRYTRGDEGFVIAQASRVFGPLDLSDAATRYFAAFTLFAIAYLGMARLVQSGFGKTLVGIRENEERARMLGVQPLRCCGDTRAQHSPRLNIRFIPCYTYFSVAQGLYWGHWLAPRLCFISSITPAILPRRICWWPAWC